MEQCKDKYNQRNDTNGTKKKNVEITPKRKGAAKKILSSVGIV